MLTSIVRVATAILSLSAVVTAQAASCSVVGTWYGYYGGITTIAANLTGVNSYPNCNVNGSMTVVMKSGNLGFTAQGTYPTASCQAGSMTSTNFDMTFAADCNSASGTATTSGTTVNTVWKRVVGLAITSPSKDGKYPLTNSNYRTTDAIPIEANSSNDANTAISWALTIEYATSGGKGASSSSSSLSTNPGVATSKSYTGQGGKLTVAALQGSNSDSVSEYVVGTAIPNSVISAQLLSLYATGATPNLLEKISMQESTYRQFAVSTLYGTSALWPLEAFDGGSHIGLMMVPTTMSDAFDWVQNTTSGSAVWNSSLSVANAREAQFRATYPALPALTATQKEDNALALYRTGTAPTKMYYYPNTGTTPVTWQVNTALNPVGVNYANSVRAQVVPN